MRKLLIIADDFTGALDTGIQFAKKGIETQVFTGRQLEGASISQTAQVLVVDSETRPMKKEEAYGTVARIVRQAVDMGVEVIYKKTDSALRGNVGSELSAVLDAAEGSRLHFIPAFPQVRRVTEGGIHYIDGVRLEESEFGQDPFDPMTSSCVAEILGRQTDKRIQSIPIGERLGEPEAEKTIVVFDARTDEDIRTRAEELKEKKELRLLAGCAGFASFLPEILGLKGKSQGEISRTGCFYVACGSLNPITREQVCYAEGEGFYRRSLTPEQKLCPEYYGTPKGRAFLEELAGVCREKRCVEVDTFDREGEETTAQYARRQGIENQAIRFSISACHGKIVRYLAEQNLDMTVLMTGGDTLMGFMQEIGVNQLHPVAEVGQGTVLSWLWWKGRRIQVISKSGGFGEKEVLVNIARQVLQENNYNELGRKTG